MLKKYIIYSLIGITSIETIFIIIYNFLDEKVVNIVFASATAFSSVGLILISVVIFYFQIRNSQNKLFTEIIQEYSSKEMYTAIRNITDFIKDIEADIDDKKDTPNEKMIKQLGIIQAYKNLYKKKQQYFKKSKRTYKWDTLDFDRRILANYFVKLDTLLKNDLLRIDLLKGFWTVKSLGFFKKYILLLNYIALPIAHGNQFEDDIEDKKKMQGIDFYNSFIDKESNEPIFDINVFYKELKDFTYKLINNKDKTLSQYYKLFENK